ncbi:MAG: hypothetical protein ACYTE3_22555 [Planctomycetota bacterium]
MDYRNIIEQLIAEYDLDSDVGRKKAYEKCIEYADCDLDFTPDYNPFLDAAAERLGQEPVRKDIARRMTRKSGTEKLHLIYSEEVGPVLTGNATGLSYLSEVLKGLSNATINGEHSHFYDGEPPLYGNSYPLTIYFEDDEWFARHARGEEANEENGSTEHEQRDVDVDKIEAFMLRGKVIVDPMMTPGKIYKVSTCHKYHKQDVWVKKIREQEDRVFIFDFNRDDGEPQQLALDLDDKEVLFFTEEHLTQLV